MQAVTPSVSTMSVWTKAAATKNRPELAATNEAAAAVRRSVKVQAQRHRISSVAIVDSRIPSRAAKGVAPKAAMPAAESHVCKGGLAQNGTP